MGATSKSFEVNGHRYTYVTHGAGEGLRISLRLVGLGVTSIASGLSGGANLEQAIGAGAGALAAALERDDAPDLCRAILAHTHRDGEALRDAHVFDAAFAGNYGELYQALVEVARGNGFLPELDTWRGLATRLGLTSMLSAATPKSSPTTSA